MGNVRFPISVEGKLGGEESETKYDKADRFTACLTLIHKMTQIATSFSRQLPLNAAQAKHAIKYCKLYYFFISLQFILHV